jgi:predicted RNA-binding Zn-ribbon protein involved in translation (DUF1610 family)
LVNKCKCGGIPKQVDGYETVFRCPKCGEYSGPDVKRFKELVKGHEKLLMAIGKM